MNKTILAIFGIFVLIASAGISAAIEPPPSQQLGSMTIEAVPGSVQADGTSYSKIIATLKDPSNQPFIGGNVYFNTNFGTLSTIYGELPPGWVNISDSKGKAYATIRSSSQGTASVTATSGSFLQTVPVEFTPSQGDSTPPVVTSPSASPSIILNDNGRARAPGTNRTTINVIVTDNIAVGTVKIDLSPIGGSSNALMTPIGGNVYSITTNAVSGINLTNSLVVNATDTSGNFNNGVSVQLTVLRRGDVVRNNAVTGADALFIKRFVVGLETMTPQQLFVADVSPASSSNTVTGADALYIKRFVVGLEEEP